VSGASCLVRQLFCIAAVHSSQSPWVRRLTADRRFECVPETELRGDLSRQIQWTHHERSVGRAHLLMVFWNLFTVPGQEYLSWPQTGLRGSFWLLGGLTAISGTEQDSRRRCKCHNSLGSAGQHGPGFGLSGREGMARRYSYIARRSRSVILRNVGQGITCIKGPRAG
jgi:hypothetical protein